MGKHGHVSRLLLVLLPLSYVLNEISATSELCDSHLRIRLQSRSALQTGSASQPVCALILQPLAQLEQCLPGLGALRPMSCGGQLETTLEIPRSNRRTRRLSQPPSFRRQMHQRSKVCPAPRTTRGPAKSGQADRTRISLAQFGFPSMKKSSSRSAEEAWARAVGSPAPIAISILS